MTDTHNCPRDGVELEARIAGPARLFVCSHCHGLWIGRRDLEDYLRSPFESWKLPGAGTAPTGVTVAHEAVRCRCSSAPLMRTVAQESVIVDVCPDCGAVWFDGGELEKIIRDHSVDSGHHTDTIGDLIGLELFVGFLCVLFSLD